MTSKIIGAAEFKATCLKIIDQMDKDHEPVVITKRGRSVAMLVPTTPPTTSIFGALKGTVKRFDDPFTPVLDPSDWNAAK